MLCDVSDEYADMMLIRYLISAWRFSLIFPPYILGPNVYCSLTICHLTFHIPSISSLHCPTLIPLGGLKDTHRPYSICEEVL